MQLQLTILLSQLGEFSVLNQIKHKINFVFDFLNFKLSFTFNFHFPIH